MSLRSKKYLCYLIIAFSITYFSFFLKHITQKDLFVTFAYDFVAYYAAAKLVSLGELTEIYVHFEEAFSKVGEGRFLEIAKEAGFDSAPPYLYPPIFIAPFQLLCPLPFSDAAIVWIILNIFLIIIVMFVQWHLAGGIKNRLYKITLIISLNLLSYPLLYSLKLGQTTIFIYAAISLLFLCVQKRYYTTAGVIIGATSAMKLYPLLFLFYFLYRKKYKPVFSSIVTIGLLIALSFIFYGTYLNLEFLTYIEQFSGITLSAWSNQSLPAFLLRQFTPLDVFVFTSLETPFFVRTIQLSFIISVLVVFKLLSSKSGHKKTEPFEMSIVVFIILLLPDISWLHYFALVNLSILVTMNYFSSTKQICSSFFINSLAVFCFVAIVMPPYYIGAPKVIGDNFITRLAVSFPFLGTLCLLIIRMFISKSQESGTKKQPNQ